MTPVILYLLFILTLLIILVNQRVIRIKFLQFLNMPYYLAPVFAAFLAVLFEFMSPNDVYQALTGYRISEGISFLGGTGPFTDVALFLSITSIAIALDVTGFFDYIAVKFLERVETSGFMIFTGIYVLTSILTLFTSNDILILTLTPFLLVFLKHLRLNPIPFLVAEFFAANILSMGLLVGNPTNIIAGISAGLNFTDYARIMILPALVAGVVSFAMLYAIFRKDICVKCHAKKLPKMKLNPWSVPALLLLAGAIASMALFSSSELLLWHIAVLWALLTLAVFALPQLIIILKNGKKLRQSYLYEMETKMPWEIIPFVFGFFVLIEAFEINGITYQIGTFLSGALSSSLVASVFGIGLLSTFAANIFNNIPMTVFFSGLVHNFTANAAGATYALIMGSNLGANLTPIGALAGIMWMKILRHRGVRITFTQFLGYGLKVTLVTALATLAAICIVLSV
jgi:arsenical pump membrane protein